MAKRWFHWVFEDGSEGVLDNNDRTDWDHGISTTEIQLAPLSAVVCEEGSRDWAVVQKMRGLRVANCHSPSSEYDTVHSIVNSLWLSGFLTLTDSPKPEVPKAESEKTQRSGGEKWAVDDAMQWAVIEGQHTTFTGSRIRTLMDEVKRLRAELDKERDWNKRAEKEALDALAELYPGTRSSGHIFDSILLWHNWHKSERKERAAGIAKSPPADLLTPEERKAKNYVWENYKGYEARLLVTALDRLAPAPAWKPRTGEMVKWWRGQASGTAPFVDMNRDAMYPYLVAIDSRMVQLAVERVEPLVRDIRPAKEESHG
jgi:hypothetical protein